MYCLRNDIQVNYSDHRYRSVYHNRIVFFSNPYFTLHNDYLLTNVQTINRDILGVRKLLHGEVYFNFLQTSLLSKRREIKL